MMKPASALVALKLPLSSAFNAATYIYSELLLCARGWHLLLVGCLMSAPARLGTISAASVLEAFDEMGHQVEGQIDDNGSGSGALFQYLLRAKYYCIKILPLLLGL